MTIEKYSMFTVADGYVLIDIKLYETILKKLGEDKTLKRKRVKGKHVYYDYVTDIFTDKDNKDNMERYMQLEKVYIKEDKMSTRAPE